VLFLLLLHLRPRADQVLCVPPPPYLYHRALPSSPCFPVTIHYLTGLLPKDIFPVLILLNNQNLGELLLLGQSTLARPVQPFLADAKRNITVLGFPLNSFEVELVEAHLIMEVAVVDSLVVMLSLPAQIVDCADRYRLLPLQPIHTHLLELLTAWELIVAWRLSVALPPNFAGVGVNYSPLKVKLRLGVLLSRAYLPGKSLVAASSEILKDRFLPALVDSFGGMLLLRRCFFALAGSPWFVPEYKATNTVVLSGSFGLDVSCKPILEYH
jgi:hypothetical protein